MLLLPTVVQLKKEGKEIIELIKKLSDLHEDGILTEDEFNEKKSDLLSYFK